jgi:MFS-type transporter involved in bile tolerance (Atg22 family)
VIVLTLLERLGKALRSPSRDTVVSIVSKGIGSGRAFGLHELIDQIGAVIGPALIGAIMLYTGNNYSITYRALLLPFTLMVLTLIYTHRRIGRRVEAESAKAPVEDRGLKRGFWLYCTAILLNTVGLIPVALLLFKASTILQPSGQQWIVPMLYVVVQLIDAPMALISGLLFDRIGVKILTVPFVLSVLPALFVSYGGLNEVIIACVVFGAVLGMQESTYRAAIAELVSITRRGTAYGIFNTMLGLGTLAGGVVYGFFIDTGVSTVLVLGYALVTQACALLALGTGRTVFSGRIGNRI